MMHDCDHQGHVWLEEDGSLMNRKRDLRKSEPIAVHCKHCSAVASLVGWGDRK